MQLLLVTTATCKPFIISELAINNATQISHNRKIVSAARYVLEMHVIAADHSLCPASRHTHSQYIELSHSDSPETPIYMSFFSRFKPVADHSADQDAASDDHSQQRLEIAGPNWRRSKSEHNNNYYLLWAICDADNVDQVDVLN